jgi:organic hydroperoxide reductase OsmC/OhrA
MSEETNFVVELKQIEDYQFKVKFDWPNVADLLLDEPQPLGQSAGPNAARLIAAAVANCLSASLLFCTRKFKQDAGIVTAVATTKLKRNEHGRVRLGEIDVEIKLGESRDKIAHLDRCAAQFEDFCVVTDSVRKGVPVHVKVVDATGAVVHED